MELWQRFSSELRQAVLRTHDNSRSRGECLIPAEQLLLGLLQLDDCTAVQLLGRLKVKPAKLREQLERRLGEGPGGEPPGDVTFTPEAQRVLQHALLEARTGGDEQIGTEHLLVGLLRETQGPGAEVLAACGVRLHEVRQAIAAERG